MRTRTVIIGAVAAFAVAGIAIAVWGTGESGSKTTVDVLAGGIPSSGSDGDGEDSGFGPQASGAPVANSVGDQYLSSDFAPAATSVPQPGGVGVSGVGTTGGVGGGPSAGAPASGGSSTLASQIDRKIVRNSTLDIQVENVLETVAKVEAAGTGNGGYVAQSNLTTIAAATDDEPIRQSALVQIRVPSDSYSAVMTSLRGYATEVTSEQSQASEVTEEYTDLESQLRNYQSTEERYLELLTRAETVNDILTVQDRLAQVRLQIEQVQGRINLLDNLTSMATITVNISLPPLPAVTEDLVLETEPNWAEEAWQDARDSSVDALESVGRTAIIAGVVMAWILAPAAVLGALWWIFGGRKGKGAATSA